MSDDMDKTMAPQRPAAEPVPDIDKTFAGRRNRKPDSRFEPGDLILNRYRVISELGQGGMGVVYKCLDETAGIEIVLKPLPSELSHNTLEMEDSKNPRPEDEALPLAPYKKGARGDTQRMSPNCPRVVYLKLELLLFEFSFLWGQLRYYSMG